jgi:hypothetical protein
LNPPTTAQFIAVVSLSNSGTVPEYCKGQSLGFLKGQSLGFLTGKESKSYDPTQDITMMPCSIGFASRALPVPLRDVCRDEPVEIVLILSEKPSVTHRICNHLSMGEATRRTDSPR